MRISPVWPWSRVLRVPLLAFAILVGCAPQQETMTAPGVVEGMIRSVGNEPFSRLALETDDGTMFVLRLGAADEAVARANQGKLARIRFSGTEIAPFGTVLHVTEIAIIEGR